MTLIDKETKKRMLEELWHDRVEIPEETAKQAESDAQAKKQAVKQLKEANEMWRTTLVKQAQEVEKGVAGLRERSAALTAQLKVAEEANAAADELRAKTAAHAASATGSRSALATAELALAKSKSECEKLTKQLERVHASAAEESQKATNVSADGDILASKLTALQSEAEAVAGETRERAAWCEQREDEGHTGLSFDPVT